MSVFPRITMRKRSRLLAAALLPFMFLIAACKMDMTVEYKDDGTAVPSVIFEDDEGKLSGQNPTCESLILRMKQSFQGRSSAGLNLNKFRMEDLSNGGNLKCKLTQKQARQESRLTKTSSGYVLKLAGNPRFSSSSFRGQIQATLKIVMPGKITEAPGNGKISGNTVKYEGPDIIAQGTQTKARKDGGSSEESSTNDEETTAKNDDGAANRPAASSKRDSDGGFPVWAWFAIGDGAVVLSGVIIFLATRKGKESGPGQAAYAVPFGQSQTPQQFGGPQALQQFGGLQAPQQFGGSQAPQQFGGPQAPQSHSQYPPQQGGDYLQDPPQQGGY